MFQILMKEESYCYGRSREEECGNYRNAHQHSILSVGSLGSIHAVRYVKPLQQELSKGIELLDRIHQY